MDIGFSVRHALRSLRTSWRFAVLTVLTLGLGFAGIATIFSVLSNVVFHSLPFADPDRLVTITETVPFMGSGPQVCTLDEFERWQKSALLEHLAAIDATELILPGDRRAELLSGSRVTPDFFKVFGVRPMLGRGFHAEDSVPGHEKVMVLSFELWARRFGQDRSIVGRSIRVSGSSFEVIGVMPPQFDFPRLADVDAVMPFAPQRSEFWVPLVITPKMIDQNNYSYYLLGRLHAGVARAQAVAEFQLSALRSLHYIVERNPAYREPLENLAKHIAIQVTPLKESMALRVRSGLWLLFGAVASSLLLVLFNLGNLLLARNTDRLRDYAIRQALGGSRAHLFLQAFLEQGILIGLASVLGFGLCSFAIHLLRTLAADRLPRVQELSVSTSSAFLLLGLSLLTAIVFGCLPLLVMPPTAGWLTPNETRSATGNRSSQRLRASLIVGEIAVSTVLLVSAGLLAASFTQVMGVSPGFDPERLLTFNISSDPSLLANRSAIEVNQRALLRSLRALPGVESASLVNVLPLTGDYSIHGVGPVGRPLNKDSGAEARLIDPEYFRTLRIPLIAGRVLREGDSASVAVINQKMARMLWSGTDAIDREFSDNGGSPIRVVGIVGDVHSGPLETEPLMQFYLPSSALPGFANSFAIRVKADPSSLLPRIERAVGDGDSSQAISGVQTMDQIVQAATLERRLEKNLLLTFAVSALCLSALGLFGVASLSVARQMREFGIRMALGASGMDVLWLTLGRNGLVVITGLGLGLFLSLLGHKTMQGFLFGVSSLSFNVYATTAGVLSGAALLAIVVPALRAVRVDPAVVLRDE